MTPPPDPRDGVAVVVAAKALARAKTRLAAAVPDAVRAPLVLAMLTDTLAAALASPEVAGVHVVTADAAVAERAAGLGAVVVAEPADAPGGLDAALLRGAATLAPGRWVAALQGDLPALRTAELTAALAGARAGGGRGLVVDADGTGTTLLVSPADLAPAFGPGSAAAHARSGATALAGAWPGLRRDVDTPADLARAVRLGVGAATARLLATTGTAATVERVGPGEGLALRTDDGAPLVAGRDAAAAGGWRALRVGQRVRVHADGDGVVRLLTVPGLTPPG